MKSFFNFQLQASKLKNGKPMWFFVFCLLFISTAFKGEKKDPFFVQILPNNKEFVVADKSGTLAKMSIPDMALVMKYQGETDVKVKIKDVAVTPDGSKVLALYNNHKLWILDVVSGQTFKIIEEVDWIIPLWDHDLIAIHFRKNLELHYYKADSDFSQSFFKIQPTTFFSPYDFSCDGKYLVAETKSDFSDITVVTVQLSDGAIINTVKKPLPMPFASGSWIYEFADQTYDVKIFTGHNPRKEVNQFVPGDLGLPATMAEKCDLPRELVNQSVSVTLYEGKWAPPKGELDPGKESIWSIRSSKEYPIKVSSASYSNDDKWIVLAQKSGNLDLYSTEDMETISNKFLGITLSYKKPKYIKSVVMP